MKVEKRKILEKYNQYDEKIKRLKKQLSEANETI